MSAGTPPQKGPDGGPEKSSCEGPGKAPDPAALAALLPFMGVAPRADGGVALLPRPRRGRLLRLALTGALCLLLAWGMSHAPGAGGDAPGAAPDRLALAVAFVLSVLFSVLGAAVLLLLLAAARGRPRIVAHADRLAVDSGLRAADLPLDRLQAVEVIAVPMPGGLTPMLQFRHVGDGPNPWRGRVPGLDLSLTVRTPEQGEVLRAVLEKMLRPAALPEAEAEAERQALRRALRRSARPWLLILLGAALGGAALFAANAPLSPW